MTLAQHVRSWAQATPDDVAIVSVSASASADGGGAWSWAELENRAEALARRFASEGVSAGDAAVLSVSLSARGIASLVAASMLGIDVVLVATLYPPARLHAAAEVTGAAFLLGDDGSATAVGAERQRPATQHASREPIVGVLTSGTTGVPKCAAHTWSSLTASVRRSERREGKRWLMAYPLSHIAALSVLAQCFVNRGTVVVPAGLGPEEAATAIAMHRVDAVSCTPTYARLLAQRAPSSFWEVQALEQIVLGGEIADGRLLTELASLAPRARIVHVYASTELGTVLVVDDGREGFDAALLDDERLSLRDGELFVATGAGSMHGYHGQDALDRRAWWPTGDMVEVVDGRALFRGRKGDVINVGGAKVWPAEVEAVLRDVDGIAAALVVGAPSSIVGNLVKACVELVPGADEAQVRQAAIASCRARLASHMVPRLFEVVAELPRTVSGKQVRSGHRAT